MADHLITVSNMLSTNGPAAPIGWGVLEWGTDDWGGQADLETEVDKPLSNTQVLSDALDTLDVDKLLTNSQTLNDAYVKAITKLLENSIASDSTTVGDVMILQTISNSLTLASANSFEVDKALADNISGLSTINKNTTLTISGGNTISVNLEMDETFSQVLQDAKGWKTAFPGNTSNNDDRVVTEWTDV